MRKISLFDRTSKFISFINKGREKFKEHFSKQILKKILIELEGNLELKEKYYLSTSKRIKDKDFIDYLKCVNNTIESINLNNEQESHLFIYIKDILQRSFSNNDIIKFFETTFKISKFTTLNIFSKFGLITEVEDKKYINLERLSRLYRVFDNNVFEELLHGEIEGMLEIDITEIGYMIKFHNQEEYLTEFDDERYANRLKENISIKVNNIKSDFNQKKHESKIQKQNWIKIYYISLHIVLT